MNKRSIISAACHNKTLSEDFIRKYIDLFDPKELSKNPGLNEKLISEFPDKIDWKSILIETFSFDFLIKNFNKFENMKKICILQTLLMENQKKLIEKLIINDNALDELINQPACHCMGSSGLMLQHILVNIPNKKFNKIEHLVDWNFVSRNRRLTFSFLRKYRKKVNWHQISKNDSLTENMVKEFKNYVDWKSVTNLIPHFKNSVEFIREMKDRIDWTLLCQIFSFNEELVEEFQDYIDWRYIRVFEEPSKEFIEKYAHKIDWYGRLIYYYNEPFSAKIIKKYGDKIIFRKTNQIPKSMKKKNKELYERFREISTVWKTPEEYIEETLKMCKF